MTHPRMCAQVRHAYLRVEASLRERARAGGPVGPISTSTAFRAATQPTALSTVDPSSLTLESNLSSSAAVCPHSGGQERRLFLPSETHNPAHEELGSFFSLQPGHQHQHQSDLRKCSTDGEFSQLRSPVSQFWEVTTKKRLPHYLSRYFLLAIFSRLLVSFLVLLLLPTFVHKCASTVA